MAKGHQNSQILLRWSDHVPASDVQDPLGLGLRGSARLASQLLYCLTSITPRARYFSFIPWCILDYQQHEKGKPYALNLRDAIIFREQALTLACVAHHEGETCDGGNLVGSRDARKWFDKRNKIANFKKLKKFSKNPALAAYLNSIVNLGFFVNENEMPDSDEESDAQEFTFEGIELSSFGLDLAKRYGSAVDGSAAVKQISTRERTCSIKQLAEFGKNGGLCELTDRHSNDRELLRDVFLATETFLKSIEKSRQKKESHLRRRSSLLLILELCRQLSADQWVLDEDAFSSAVYYGTIDNEEDHLKVAIPTSLIDIASRWRMFYFHHFMAVALEGLFSWLVSQLGALGLAGATVELLVAQLDESSVRKHLSEILHVDVKGTFGNLSPSTLFASIGLPVGDLDTELSKLLDKKVPSLKPFAENSLESNIRDNEYLYSSTGLALPMILLATTLARYTQWESSDYGKWLAGVADPKFGHDPYLDLVPPLVCTGLSRRFGNWWQCSWKELTGFVLSRYVIQQHQAMSYEKTRTGERCLLQVDGSKVISMGGYNKIGMGNPRLDSAIQVLKDLGLMRDDKAEVTNLTREGERFLKRELANKVNNEVS